jgi:hypothetical protein
MKSQTGKAQTTGNRLVSMAHLYQTVKVYKGNIKATCELLNMDRNYFYVLVKRNPKLKDVVENSRFQYRKLTGRLRHKRTSKTLFAARLDKDKKGKKS